MTTILTAALRTRGQHLLKAVGKKEADRNVNAAGDFLQRQRVKP